MPTAFAAAALDRPRPGSLRGEDGPVLPRRVATYPSPARWRDEVLYFLLVDRFSDGGEDARPLLDRGRPRRRPAAAAGVALGPLGRSGGDRWQGGTLAGVTSKLDYLQRLGVTTLWLSPVFKQRGHLDTYHGYGIQDFLDVDPRFGTRADLVDLVAAAHERGLRIILDIIFNHSGATGYPPDTPGGRGLDAGLHHGPLPFGAWAQDAGGRVAVDRGPDDGVWPAEFQDPEPTRAPAAATWARATSTIRAEHKRTDFMTCATSRPGGRRPAAACSTCRWLLQVLDRAHRLRRLPHRHAEARLARGGTQLLRQRSRSSPPTWARQLLAGRRDRRRRLRGRTATSTSLGRTSTPRWTSARCGSR